ncbi:TolC family protein [Vibrio tubiashii]|uniref:TolC family protein n=1 Tax=Vibrio tubiashii TaxID=29498 RepID=UPI001EFDC313|nr:TolC family protein [Vibrio tubiashii]MCG9582441.1 TolC family protein [Vibrio tubiashii]MCG9616032.1 TolC family protein [Vibrio tubiashii]MCG9689419.1 TolC family protein [Vibrio tubiashii]
MTIKQTYLRCALLFSVVLASGCSSLNPPTYSNSNLAITIPEAWDNSHNYVNSQFSTQLLALINDEKLSVLVRETLVHNHDLRITALRLRQAKLLAAKRENYLQPKLTSTYQASRERSISINSNHKLSLDLSWELDVWGRLADSANAENSRAKATELDYIYAQNSLVARVIQAWLDISYRSEIIKIEEQWIKSLLDTEQIITERILDGSKEQADLDTSRSATSRVKASLASRKLRQLTAIRNLKALRGGNGESYDAIPSTVPTILAPPLKLPGELIGSRPDLLSAYQKLLAADRDTSIAYKELLPKVTFTASLYRAGSSPNQLSQNPSLWSLVGGITAPIFNQGTLEMNAKIVALKANEAFLNYEKKLLNAMTEVGIALDNEYYLSLQEQHYGDARIHSLASMRNYKNRYQEGSSDILTLLIAQQSIYQSSIQLLQTQQSRFSNRVSLGLALGMGV